MGRNAELRQLLERHWGAQCQFVGKETLGRLLDDVENGSANVETWAVKKGGGAPMDVEIALTTLSTGIAFLQLALQVHDELAKRKRPTAVELKGEIRATQAQNSPELRVLDSERGQKIIDELTD